MHGRLRVARSGFHSRGHPSAGDAAQAPLRARRGVWSDLCVAAWLLGALSTTNAQDCPEGADWVYVGNPPPAPAGQCEGECDGWADGCGSGLSCWQREDGEDVPGCTSASTGPSGPGSSTASSDYCSAGLSAAEQATYTFSFIGYCPDDTGYLQLYAGVGDNPMGVQGCAFGCMSRTKTSLTHSWDAPEFATVTGFFLKDNGLCYCTTHDSSTCARSGTTTADPYITYDFVRSPHSKRYR